MEKILIISVDRDNDLGRKTNVQGPVIGREANLKAASKLALADPAESDANCIFAAVKKFDELKPKFQNLEIAAVTGIGKSGFESDREISRQLDIVLEKFPAEGFVLVTNGAEDDQVIPVLQSRAKIVSKETVIIKQAMEIESAFFTVKEALKDPYIARIAFGLPGIVLLFYALTFLYGAQALFIQGLMLIVGAYLLLKGFGIEEMAISNLRRITGSISLQRISSLFYIGAFFIIAFGAYTALNNFMGMQMTDLLLDSVSIIQSTYIFLVLAALSMIIGRILDVIHFKKAYLIRKYLLTGVSVIMIWFILDAGTLVFLRQADLAWFLITLIGSFAILLFSFRVLSIMDIKEKITKLLIGLPVYNKEGKWLGKVEKINKAKNSIAFADFKTKELKEIQKEKFKMREGRILLTQ
jgi:putative membrane protein